MLKNYLLTAWRNLTRNKFYSTLNIVGLAAGLAVGIMILLWVQDELSYDDFHSRADRIFKVNAHLGTGTDEQIWEGSPAPLAGMSRAIPEIELSVRIMDQWTDPVYSYYDKKFTEPRRACVDSTFFNVFDFKLINGNSQKLFRNSHSVILSETIAKKFFGNENPIGKVISEGGRENFEVTGVMKDFPSNSTLQYAMLFPMSLQAERFRGNGNWKTIDEDLGNYTYKIFFLLKNASDYKEAQRKISEAYEVTRESKPVGKSFTLQPLTDLHLYTIEGNAAAMQRVRTFILVAIFILVIACINYVNLSTARSVLRSKEVSMRKIIGAGKRQLFFQFIIESMLIFALSSLLAFGIIKMLLPLYNDISGKTLSFSLGDAQVWILLAVAVIGSLALASIYPAMLLSSFHPIEALKGRIGTRMGNAAFRKVLVVTQFVFSVILIIATVVVAQQLKFMREKELGFDKQHVFSFSLRDESYEHSIALKTELSKVKGAVMVSGSDGDILGVNASTGDTEWEGKAEGRTFLVNVNMVDKNFIPLFRMQLKEGKNFTGSKADSAHLILNETAVKEAGITNPIGKRFELWGIDATIIGVVKDYNYASLKERIEPMIFAYTDQTWRVFVKTTGRDAKNVLAEAEQIWKKFDPQHDFTYSFVDESYDKLYKSEERTGTLFNVFSIVAIAISCLGLLGLATYTAEVRRREVGIRKVLGASVVNITGMLVRNFVGLILISLVVAIPVAWWAMNSWLQDFVYRIQLSWWIFAAASVVALTIAGFTVGFQAIRAALVNPVNSLKEE